MSKIFDNIADVENYLRISVSIPSDIPEDTTILCYDDDGDHPYIYKQNQDSLQYTGHYIGGEWRETGSKSLEEEVEWDIRNGYKFAYLRLATKDNSDVFTPERLLGVETNTGFITSVEVIFYMGYRARVTTTKGFSYFMETLDYYISDVSDETVPFEQYVRIFYEE